MTFIKVKREDIINLIELRKSDKIVGLETIFNFEEYDYYEVFWGLENWFNKYLPLFKYEEKAKSNRKDMQKKGYAEFSYKRISSYDINQDGN